MRTSSEPVGAVEASRALLPAESREPAGAPDVVEQVRLAQEGSAHAFALLYDRYFDQVFAYVYHRVGHRQTAEDLVSDVFLRALRRIGSFRWQGVDFGAWLTTIARNRVHDHFKSSRFRLESTVGEVYDTPQTGSPDDPEQAAVDGDLARQVREAMSRLNDEQAEVLYLRFIQHLNVAETGAVMGKTDGAVKALQYRALKSLAKLVPQEMGKL
ncbi:MAG TPA: sigma-70 family RNA polymerase sigma factor [Egibacteraceae bacterium]|nr:sigma-70 family RNA polymerase sigma factor [Egibacteraceae bacterium]